MKKSSSKKKKTQDQHPHGVLKKDLVGQFNTVREEIAELAIDNILPVQIIPEYRHPTESLHPIVIQTPEACQCIDGWDIINKVKADGESAVCCHIFKIDNHSDIELAIRKVSIRSKPQGGQCSYPELLRNTRLLAQIIIQETENPVIYSHGGRRRGNGFTQNREDDVREILAERLGKSRTTINTYLNQSRHINEDTFNALIDADVGRSFFDECRVSKRNLIKNMESDDVDEQEITEAVSTKMFDWLDEYIQTGKIVTVYGVEIDADGDEQTVGEENNPENNESSTGALQEDEVLQHQKRIDTDAIPLPPTEEQIKAEIQAIISSLTVVLEQSPIDIDAALDILHEDISKCALIQQMLMDIQDHCASNPDGEAK